MAMSNIPPMTLISGHAPQAEIGKAIMNLGEAIAYYRMLVEAGIQDFVVETLDAADGETIRLLAEKVVPEVKRRQ